MIVEKNKINTEVFIAVFTKKFQNFCDRVPLFVSYDVALNSVTIYQYIGEDMTKKKILTHEFDFSKNVKSNIYEIRKYLLEKYYPIMRQKIPKKYLDKELNAMVSNGEVSLDDIHPDGYILNSNGEFVKNTSVDWRIEKFITQKDYVFVRNLDTNELKRYRLKIPCTFFVKKILNEIQDLEKRYDFFISKSKYVGEGYDVDANNKVIEKEI